MMPLMETLVEKQGFYGEKKEIQTEQDQDIAQNLDDLAGPFGGKNGFHLVGDENDQGEVGEGPEQDGDQEKDHVSQGDGDENPEFFHERKGDHPGSDAQGIDHDQG